MLATQFNYPGPQWFAEALGASYVQSWIKASRQPYWRRPATLAVLASSARRDADDEVRAFQLCQEMALFSRQHGQAAGVADVYWDPGVTSLTEPALRTVRAAIADYFDVEAGAGFTAHVVLPSGQPMLLPLLRKLGVTTLRASIAPHGRSLCTSIDVFFDQARELGFRTIAVDLPIAVPNISTRTVRELAAALSSWRPSRLLLSRAHGEPSRGRRGATPGDWACVRRAWQEVYAAMIGAGYEYIAHDAFALPSDEFIDAKRIGALVPRTYGYSAHASYASIAIGPGAIGNVGPMQYQNCRTPESYAASVQQGLLPIERGLLSTPDDLIRRSVMTGLLTAFSVDIETIEECYGIDFDTAFEPELALIAPLEREGLVERGTTSLSLTPIGRFACDRVVDIFDRRSRRLEQVRPERGGL